LDLWLNKQAFVLKPDHGAHGQIVKINMIPVFLFFYFILFLFYFIFILFIYLYFYILLRGGTWRAPGERHDRTTHYLTVLFYSTILLYCFAVL